MHIIYPLAAFNSVPMSCAVSPRAINFALVAASWAAKAASLAFCASAWAWASACALAIASNSLWSVLDRRRWLGCECGLCRLLRVVSWFQHWSKLVVAMVNDGKFCCCAIWIINCYKFYIIHFYNSALFSMYELVVPAAVKIVPEPVVNDELPVACNHNPLLVP